MADDLSGPSSRVVLEARAEGKTPSELAETWGLTVEEVRARTMASPPIYADVEEWRRIAVYRLESVADDLQDLLGDDALASTSVGAMLYMRLLSTIEMQGKLLGALQQGPPMAEALGYEILGVDLTRALPPMTSHADDEAGE